MTDADAIRQHSPQGAGDQGQQFIGKAQGSDRITFSVTESN